jgi:nucleoside-diphosphate-sugar epimerase
MKAFVTGGGGFLGNAIIRQLIARGDEVISFSRGKYPDLEKLGVKHAQGDLANEADVCSAMGNCDIVFHAAAKAEPWGQFEDYFRTNVMGTLNIINACKKMGVSRLVYTSSPCVVFNGKKNLEGIDESAPYGKDFNSSYQKTKTTAELIVLVANSDQLATVALRPHLIWGPGDKNLIPRLVERARKRQLKIVGNGKNIIDHVFIDNAAKAHLQAADHLAPGSVAAGKAYFISNDEPYPIGVMINRFLQVYGLPPVRMHVPVFLAYFGGWFFENLYTILKLKSEPLVTRFLAYELSTSHWFNISAARRDFGYKPEISFDKGLELLRASIRD